MGRFPSCRRTAVGLALAMALAMALPFAAVQAQTFLTVPVNLSGTGQAVTPAIAVGPSGDINVAWLDSGAIRFRRSVDGGQTFSLTMAVANTNLPSKPSQPQIAVNAGGVYVAWAGTNASGGGDIFFSSLASGTNNWLSPPVNVSAGLGISSGSSAPVPHMVVDPGGGVDIVWGQSAAYFARTTNAGSSFATLTPLSASPMASVSPRIAVNSQGTVYAVWENADPNFPTTNCPTITFARSINNGVNFTDYPVDDTLIVNQVTQTGCTFDAQIALGANNTIHLLWANDHSSVSSIRDVITTYQTDSGGTSFAGFDKNSHQGFQNLSTTSSYTPEMAIDTSGNINVVWIGDYLQNGGPPAVYFSRSTSGGALGTFSTPQPLTAPPKSGLATAFPQIVAEPSGAMDVMWQQASVANPSGAYDILLARSTDGVKFTTTTLDNVPTTQGGTGQIAADGSGNVYAVWQGSSGSGSDVLLNGDSAGLTTGAQFSLSGIKISVSPASAVINVGGSASFALSLGSTNSVPGSLTLACGGAPAGVNCSFSPNPVNVLANASTSATLSVSVTAKPSPSEAERNPGGLSPWPGRLPASAAWTLGFATLVALLVAGQRRRKAMQFARLLALLLFLATAAAGIFSCGGSTKSGGGGSITFPLTLQAQANSGTANFQGVSITVP